MSASSAQKEQTSYRELGPLAEGGMAELFAAESEDGSAVVIKRIRPAFVFDDTYRALFFDEGQVQKCICHPNVVRLLDKGEDERGPYLVFERVFGTDLGIVLDAAFAQKKPLELAQVLAVAIPLFEALDCVHRACADDGACLDVIHRDISPGNVLLSETGDVKLADFGVAKSALKTQHTVVGEMKGKFAYMAPEQTRGDAVCPKADFFAAGIVLYECLTAEKLFDGPSDVDIVQAVRESDVAAPSSLNPDVPPQLDALVLRLLEKNVDERPKDAQQVADELKDIALSLCLETGQKRQVSRLARAHPRVSAISDGDSLRRKTQRVMGAAPKALVVTAANSRRKSAAITAGVALMLAVGAYFASQSFAPNSFAPNSFAPSGAANDATNLSVTTIQLPDPAVQPPDPEFQSPNAGIQPPNAGIQPPNAGSAASPLKAESGNDAVTLTAAQPRDSSTSPRVTASRFPKTTLTPTKKRTTTKVITKTRPTVKRKEIPKAKALTTTPLKIDEETKKAKKIALAPADIVKTSGFGKLFLSAEPWARVIIDGSPLGQNTPVVGLRLPAGRHVIKLINPIYKLSRTLVVNVPTSGEVREFVDLAK